LSKKAKLTFKNLLISHGYSEKVEMRFGNGMTFQRRKALPVSDVTGSSHQQF